jgi:hypothetical protein
MKAYWGSLNMAPLFLTPVLDGVSDQLQAPDALPPGKVPKVPIGLGVWWAPESVCTLWRGK